jgi:hypothetical protein
MLKLDLNPPQKQLRQFAWFSLLGFPAIGWLILHLWHGASTTTAWVFTAIGVAVFVLGMANTKLVKPIFLGLMIIAVPIGYVLSMLVLGLLYYGLFTPVALLFKLIGRDKLHRRAAPNATTYWFTRPAEVPAARYLRMY